MMKMTKNEKCSRNVCCSDERKKTNSNNFEEKKTRIRGKKKKIRSSYQEHLVLEESQKIFAKKIRSVMFSNQRKKSGNTASIGEVKRFKYKIVYRYNYISYAG